MGANEANRPYSPQVEANQANLSETSNSGQMGANEANRPYSPQVEANQNNKSNRKRN